MCKEMPRERISGLQLLENLGFEKPEGKENFDWNDLGMMLFDNSIYTGSQLLNSSMNFRDRATIYGLTTNVIQRGIESGVDGNIYVQEQVVIECNRVTKMKKRVPILEYLYNLQSYVFMILRDVTEHCNEDNVVPVVTEVYFYNPEKEIGDPDAVEIIYSIMKRNDGGYFDIHCDEMGFRPKFEIPIIMAISLQTYVTGDTSNTEFYRLNLDVEDEGYKRTTASNNWTILYGSFMVIKKYLEMVEFASYQDEAYTEDLTFNFRKELD